MKRILLIHPTKRPEEAHKAAEYWLSLASDKHLIKHCYSIDNGDQHPVLCNTLDDRGEMLETWVFSDNNSSAIEAINNCASRVYNEYDPEIAFYFDIIVVMSDDFRCPDNWDELIVQAAAGRTDWLMKTSDGTQGWLVTLPIMDVVYYERFGYIYYPGYQHMFADTEMTHVADLLDKKIDASHLLFPHMHYTTGQTPKDAINEKNDRTWQQGEDLYLERMNRNFDLLQEQIIGKLPKSTHIQWLKEKGINL